MVQPSGEGVLGRCRTENPSDLSTAVQLQLTSLLLACCSPQEFGPTGKEGKLMLPHPAGNNNGRNILQVGTSACQCHSSWNCQCSSKWQVPLLQQFVSASVTSFCSCQHHSSSAVANQKQEVQCTWPVHMATALGGPSASACSDNSCHAPCCRDAAGFNIITSAPHSSAGTVLPKHVETPCAAACRVGHQALRHCVHTSMHPCIHPCTHALMHSHIIELVYPSMCPAGVRSRF